jgi:UDP-3-O-[3-hydroxymyristoyl] glucosamine N-acyltransferase
MFEDRGDQGGGVHPSAVVAADVKLGEGVSIGPCCVLESGCSVGRRTRIDAGCFIGSGTTLGEDCRLYPRVVIRERTRVGQRVIIHPGAVIGSDGFGYYREGASWQKIPQLGTVQIGDDTEIGANVTIDRARVGTTAIGSGVKIDNLVQVAHNVKIGDNTAMAAQAGISGSSRIGGNVMIGGQAGVSGHLSVGDQSVVFARGGVTKDVPAGSKVSGFPAMDHRKQMRLNAEWVNLQKRRQRIRELENRIEQLESRLAD